jgi:phosphatidylinositol phospholipase C delta
LNFFKDVDLNNVMKLSLSGFKLFLNDKNYNDVYNTNRLYEKHNKDLPVNKYFMFSSHNTYLTKDQIFGESSVDMYSFAVLSNCRLVELDCWVYFIIKI